MKQQELFEIQNEFNQLTIKHAEKIKRLLAQWKLDYENFINYTPLLIGDDDDDCGTIDDTDYLRGRTDALAHVLIKIFNYDPEDIDHEKDIIKKRLSVQKELSELINKLEMLSSKDPVKLSSVMESINDLISQI